MILANAGAPCALSVEDNEGEAKVAKAKAKVAKTKAKGNWLHSGDRA